MTLNDLERRNYRQMRAISAVGKFFVDFEDTLLSLVTTG